MTQHTFISIAADVADDVASGLRAGRVPGKRGRGATPQVKKAVTLERPNRFGRRKLRFRYRPLRRWTAEQLDLAQRGITYYFRRIGGFQLADDAILRAFIDALVRLGDEAAALDLEPAVLVRWAIDAKAASLAGETPEEVRHKRTFTGRPESFFERHLEYWLDQSDERAERVRRRAQAARDADLKQRIDALNPEPRTPNPEPRTPNPASPADPLIELWHSLPRERQFRALRAVDQQWKQQCANYGENPQSEPMQDLLRAIAANWARDTWPNLVASPDGAEHA